MRRYGIKDIRGAGGGGAVLKCCSHILVQASLNAFHIISIVIVTNQSIKIVLVSKLGNSYCRLSSAYM